VAHDLATWPDPDQALQAVTTAKTLDDLPTQQPQT
jgi:hypothetical protein